MTTNRTRKAHTLFFISILLFVLIGCSIYSTKNDAPSAAITELSNTGTPTTSLSIVSTPTITTTLVPTPTARIFTEPSNCDQTEIMGHILFLRQGENPGLYIMDGNACFQHLVLQDASGSPDWSVDGKRISIGCDDKFICILDAPATLAECLKSNEINQPCTPSIIGKYALPSREGKSRIYITSWSFDGKQIIVESENFSGQRTRRYVDILKLNNGEWKTLFDGFQNFHPDMSPTKSEVILDGIFIMPLDGGTIETYNRGSDAVWSADGKKIAHLISMYWPENNGKESVSIDEWDFTSEPRRRTLYAPPNLDEHYWPRQNLRLGDDSGNYRVLSWSLDGRYLAFVAGLYNMFDNQIFRLDTKTGDIVILTNRLGDYGYVAPAWGP